MNTYRSIYFGADGTRFVGEEYTTENLDEYMEAEKQVLRDITDLEYIEVCEVVRTLGK